MMEDKKINILQPFREQYTLTISSEINLMDAYIKSETELRYDFQVLEVKEDHLEVRLLVLENRMLNTNSPMVKEVAQISQVFGRMYNELHLTISFDGKVIKVLNTDLILSKWAETKAEMQKHISGNPDLEQAILMNDGIYNSPDKVKIAIQANEFFSMYFGQIYNEALPKAQKVAGSNIFNTANIEWVVNSEEMIANSSEKNTCIITDMHPVRPFSEGYLNAAYHHFKDKANISPSEIKMFQRDERYIEKQSGKLIESLVKKQEELVPKKLYQKFVYKMISDTEKRKQKEKQAQKQESINQSQQEVAETIEGHPKKIYKIVDGKELTYEEWKQYEERQWQIYQDQKKKKGFFGF